MPVTTNLDSLAPLLYETATQKGFWDSEVDFPFLAYKVCMLHSEATEIMEAIRKEKGSAQILDEMADVVIRLLDLYEGMKKSGWLVGSLDEAVHAKAVKNINRPVRHGVLG